MTTPTSLDTKKNDKRVRRRDVFCVLLGFIAGGLGTFAVSATYPRIRARWLAYAHLANNTHHWEVNQPAWTAEFVDIGPAATHALGQVVAGGKEPYDRVTAASILFRIATEGNRDAIPYLDRGISTSQDERARTYLRTVRLWLAPPTDLWKEAYKRAKMQDSPLTKAQKENKESVGSD